MTAREARLFEKAGPLNREAVFPHVPHWAAPLLCQGCTAKMAKRS